MSKQEFLDMLGKTLRRDLSVQETEQNLQYYEQYFAQRMREGMTEQQVLDELGDPRLIAKTILDVEQQKEELKEEAEDAVYTEDGDGNFQADRSANDGAAGGHQIRLKSFQGIKAWIVLALVLLLVLFLLKTAFVIIWKLLPIILIVTGALWIYEKFVRR